MKIHPYAELFPMMGAEAFELLKADIKANGLQEYPITDSEGALLDGRNRVKALKELGLEVHLSEVDVDCDPLAYVISANLHRRHLTTTQRSSVAAKLANIKHGHNQHAEKVDSSNELSTSIGDTAKLLNVSVASVKRAKTVEKVEAPNGASTSVEQAANLLNVSKRNVTRAKTVIDNGSADLVAAMDRDDITTSKAAALVKAVPSKKGQSRLLSKGKDAIDAATKKKTVKVKTHFEKFKVVWDAADDNGRTAIRAFILDDSP